MPPAHHCTVTTALSWFAVGVCSAILVGLLLRPRHPQRIGQQTGYVTLSSGDLNPRARRDILDALSHAEQELR